MASSRVHDKIIPIDADTPAEVKRTTLQEKQQQSEEEKKRSGVAAQVIQVFLRSLAGLCMLGATIMMLFNEQTSVVAGFSVRASYRASPTLKFFLIGTGVSCVYSILSIPMVYCCHKSCFLHFLDMTVMALAMAAASAATAVGYIGKFGNEETGWTEVCNYYDRFCSRAMISVGCSYIGFLFLFMICSLSSFTKAKSSSHS